MNQLRKILSRRIEDLLRLDITCTRSLRDNRSECRKRAPRERWRTVDSGAQIEVVM
jgi:hypothetical protein